MRGVDLDTNNTIRVQTTNSQAWIMDCTLFLTSSNDYVGTTGDGTQLILINVTINCANATNGISATNGGTLRWLGGSYTGTAVNGMLTDGTANIGTGGGGTIEVIGVDLSNMAASSNLANNFGATQGSDDGLAIIVNKCKLSSNTTIGFEETLTNADSYLLVTECDSTSADSEWQYYYEDYFGTVEAVPDNVSGGIVRNTGGDTFNGGRKVSYKMTSNANTSILTPLRFPVPSRFAALATAATDTPRVYFTSTATLTDNDFWLNMIYMDGTNKQTPNAIYGFDGSLSFSGSGVAAGTAHTSDTGSDWEDNAVDLTGYNEYYDDLDTSGDAGADGVPFIEAYLAEPSTTVYIDAEIDLN